MAQKEVDKFYKTNGPCCAGCDFWRWHNSVIGDCTKSAPVSGAERWSMLNMGSLSLNAEAGHIVTPRHHLCGDFKDEN